MYWNVSDGRPSHYLTLFGCILCLVLKRRVRSVPIQLEIRFSQRTCRERINSVNQIESPEERQYSLSRPKTRQTTEASAFRLSRTAVDDRHAFYCILTNVGKADTANRNMPTAHAHRVSYNRSPELRYLCSLFSDTRPQCSSATLSVQAYSRLSRRSHSVHRSA